MPVEDLLKCMHISIHKLLNIKPLCRGNSGYCWAEAFLRGSLGAISISMVPSLVAISPGRGEDKEAVGGVHIPGFD